MTIASPSSQIGRQFDVADQGVDVWLTVPARLSIVLAPPGEGRDESRVRAPDRVLRAWAMLNAADAELQRADLPPAAVRRLGQQLQTVSAELQRSLSPELARECGLLVGVGKRAPLGARELRLAYASLLGWTGGLVIGMLSQLEAAHASRAGGSGTGPDTPDDTSSSPGRQWSGMDMQSQIAALPRRGRRDDQQA